MASSEDLTPLLDHLDTLWIKYMTFLDEYTACHASIGKHMASGFFSLAQANFHSSGRRFGRDYYDGRATASTKVEYFDHQAKMGVRIIEAPTSLGGKVQNGGRVPLDFEPASKDEEGIPPNQLPSPGQTPEPEIETRESSSGTKDTSERGSTDPKTPAIDTHDPLRWFGILVPPHLRSAQKSFVSALLGDNAMSEAVNAVRGMRDVEMEIRKVRKAIRKVERAIEVGRGDGDD